MSGIINYLRMNLRSWIGNEKGASAVEYTLLLVMVAIAIIFAIQPINEWLGEIWTTIRDALVAVGTGS